MNKISRFSIILLIIVLDQLTKHYIISFLKQQVGMLYELLPILDIVYTWNYGISFGILSDYYQYSNNVFMLINTVIIGFLLYEYRRLTNGLEIIGFTLIIGGAIGNLIDRVIYGAVFDFIHFHYKSHYFAAFNIADACISIGVFFVFLKFIYSRK